MAEKGGLLMRVEKPYFMTNDDWYYFDEGAFCFKLTEKASEKAKKSYEEYYSEVYTGAKVGD